MMNRHLKRIGGKTPLTAVGDHINTMITVIDINNVKIIGREERFWERKIREILTLNRDSGYEWWPSMTIC